LAAAEPDVHSTAAAARRECRCRARITPALPLVEITVHPLISVWRPEGTPGASDASRARQRRVLHSGAASSSVIRLGERRVAVVESTVNRRSSRRRAASASSSSSTPSPGRSPRSECPLRDPVPTVSREETLGRPDHALRGVAAAYLKRLDRVAAAANAHRTASSGSRKEGITSAISRGCPRPPTLATLTAATSHAPSFACPAGVEGGDRLSSAAIRTRPAAAPNHLLEGGPPRSASSLP